MSEEEDGITALALHLRVGVDDEADEGLPHLLWWFARLPYTEREGEWGGTGGPGDGEGREWESERMGESVCGSVGEWAKVLTEAVRACMHACIHASRMSHHACTHACRMSHHDI